MNTASPAHKRRRFYAAVCLVLGVGALVAWWRHERLPSPPLEVVEPPPDLEQLDDTVRRQFTEIWDDVSASFAGVPQTRAGQHALSAAYGRLGLWFDTYRYADSAARCYRNAGALDPTEPRWPYHLGGIAEHEGELDAAVVSYTRASTLDPENAAPRERLGDIALRRQDLDAAETIYRGVLALNPESPASLLGLANVALARGQSARAVAPLEKLLAAQPEASQALYALGTAMRQLGDDAKADALLARVPAENAHQTPVARDAPWDEELAQMNQGARGYTQRGIAAARRGHKHRAAIWFGRAVTADADGPEKRINYALSLARIGWRDAAREEFLAALQFTEPNSELAARAHIELGKLLTVERPREALAHLETAVAIAPREIAAHVELARLYQYTGRLNDAVEQYARARDDEAAHPEVRFWYAATLALSGETARAIDATAEDLRKLGAAPRIAMLRARLLATDERYSVHSAVEMKQLLAQASLSTTDVFDAQTHAMVAAAERNFTAAVRWQTAAIAALDASEMRPARSVASIARRRLVLYQRHEPCHTPWEATELLVPVAVTLQENTP